MVIHLSFSWMPHQQPHACQSEIWIPFHVPECCVDFIDICGAGGHLAVGVWCRFSFGDCSYSLGPELKIERWIHHNLKWVSPASYSYTASFYPPGLQIRCHRNRRQEYIVGKEKKQQKHLDFTAKSKSFLTPRGTWDLKHASKISAWWVPVLPKGRM